LRRLAFSTGVCVLLLCGCMSFKPPGHLISDPAQQSRVLGFYQYPQVHMVLFRSVIRWGKREVPLTEVVKVLPEGGYSVAGITDIGSTLYAVRIAAQGPAKVLRKALPFSDAWLTRNLVAELMVPWTAPPASGQLYRLPDGACAWTHTSDHTTVMYTFSAAGQWRTFRRFSGNRVRCVVELEWDGQSVPSVMRVRNFGKHYQVVRERIAAE